MRSAGSPKAAEWLILYTVHMVLILIPKWHSLGRNPTNSQTKKLKTVATLTSIINCVMNHKLTEDDIKYLDKELINYQTYLQEYWGREITPKPTIHIAQHITDIIVQYGPPSIYSTWAGERINGMMKDIKKK